MSLPDMTPGQLLDAATQVAEQWPDAILIKNQVGNLTIVVFGQMAGYIDLRTGEVVETPE